MQRVFHSVRARKCRELVAALVSETSRQGRDLRFLKMLASVVFLGLVLAAPRVCFGWGSRRCRRRRSLECPNSSSSASPADPIPFVPEVPPVLLNDEIWSEHRSSEIARRRDRDADRGRKHRRLGAVLSPEPTVPSADKDASAQCSISNSRSLISRRPRTPSATRHTRRQTRCTAVRHVEDECAGSRPEHRATSRSSVRQSDSAGVEPTDET